MVKTWYARFLGDGHQSCAFIFKGMISETSHNRKTNDGSGVKYVFDVNLFF